jgi:PA14 domain
MLLPIGRPLTAAAGRASASLKADPFLVLASCRFLAVGGSGASALPSGFQETTLSFTRRVNPSAIEFADARVCWDRDGRIKVFSNLGDSSSNLLARVTDAQNQSATSAPVTMTADNAPASATTTSRSAWTGRFDLGAGSYGFSARADDGFRLWVAGQQLVNAWIDQGTTTYSTSKALAAGDHEVKLEYYESAGKAVAQLSWVPL